MLLRSTGVIKPGLSLLTLGNSCHYLFAEPGKSIPAALGDPGCSAHIRPLLERVVSVGVAQEQLAWVFLSGADAHRIGGLPLLRTLLPKIKVAGTATLMAAFNDDQFVKDLYTADGQLSLLYERPAPLSEEEFRSHMTIDWVIGDTNYIELPAEIRLRPISARGHSRASSAYLLEPFNFVLSDQSLGYYRGRELATPGCDHSLEDNIAWLESLAELDPRGLCFPSNGALTGDSARQYVSSLVQNCRDLAAEVGKAKERAMTDETILQLIRDAFFGKGDVDPGVSLSMEHSLANLALQLGLRESICA